MKISSIKLKNFRRFNELHINDLPESAKLVVLAGPNGKGKSSLFDGMYLWQQIMGGIGWNGDLKYYRLDPSIGQDWSDNTRVNFHSPAPNGQEEIKKALYFRSAYRNEAQFKLQSLSTVGSPVGTKRFSFMIEADAAVSDNYTRLVSQSLVGSLSTLPGNMTLDSFRDETTGEIRRSLARIFPDLIFDDLGNPFEQGTFTFTKGNARRFEYKNLSGGEKAVFDLVLDIVVKKAAFDGAVFCIDEPEAHMNTRLQGKLLEELYNLIPESSQLWIATHSIGMMRKAKELYDADNGKVIFLDFGGSNFDAPVTMRPVPPTRKFWEDVLSVALDDLATLVVPSKIVLCEGNPIANVQGKNSEFDAECYNTIFGDTHPDVKFISAGNSNSVAVDRLSFAASLPRIASGITVMKLIDRDDHAPGDVVQLSSNGVTVLNRRNIEAYLFDDEVITALCNERGQPQAIPQLIAAMQNALTASIARGNATDDLKSAAGDFYVQAKRVLGLTGVGNNAAAFAKATMAPLIKPGMNVYAALKADIFGA
ncbi:ATPase AAA-type core domain-containing protein [Methylorubrum thiocyanatum]